MSQNSLSNSNEPLCNPTEFEKVYKATSKALTHFLYYKFGDLEKAKNFTQDAFIRLWNNCQKIAIEKAKSFVYTTAQRLFLDDIAHEKVALKFVNRAKYASAPAEATDDALRAQEFKEALEKAISELPEKQRTVFLMNRIDKMKYAEIADALQLSVKTVEKHVSQSLMKIRASISEFGTFKF